MATDALLSFNSAPGAPTALPLAGYASSGSLGPVIIPGVQRSHTLYIRILYSAATAGASGVSAIQFKSQVLNPNGFVIASSSLSSRSSGFYDQSVNAGEAIPLLATGSGEGVVYIPVATEATQVRLAYVITGNGNAPGISVVADLVTSKD